MTRHVDGGLRSHSAHEITESSGPAQAGLADASQEPVSKNGRKGLDGKSSHSGFPLPCPLRAAEPERYEKIEKGCAGGKYKGMRMVNEHIWRYHSWETRCTKCWKTFRRSSHKSVSKDKAGHDCKPRELTKEEEAKTIPCMSEELTEKWRNWKDSPEQEASLKEKDSAAVAIKHWKVVFEIVAPGKKAPDLESICSSAPAPLAPNPSTQQPCQQPRRKRQASSPPAGERMGLKETPFDAEQQTAEQQTIDGQDEQFTQDGVAVPLCIDPKLLCLGDISTVSGSVSDSASIFSSRTRYLGNGKTALHPDSTMPTTTGTSVLDRLGDAPADTDLDNMLPTFLPADSTEAEDCVVFGTILGPHGAEAPVDDSGCGYRKTIDDNDLDNSTE